MPKKVIEEVGEPPVGGTGHAPILNKKIVPIAHDFLREDVNELRDKLNQVIDIVNNL